MHDLMMIVIIIRYMGEINIKNVKQNGGMIVVVIIYVAFASAGMSSCGTSSSWQTQTLLRAPSTSSSSPWMRCPWGRG